MVKKRSQGPYLLNIQEKFKKNEEYIDNPELLTSNNKSSSPTSGSEFMYDPDKWNLDSNIRESHNCYSYAFGKIVPKLRNKAQPGYGSGFDHINDDEYNCKAFRERLKKDAPASYLEKFDNQCMPGFYKIFLALDPGNDYHWWRQDKNSLWSHKPGQTKAVNVDSDGKEIKNPLLANRNYGSLNYHKPCFFACIYSDLSRSIDFIYN